MSFTHPEGTPLLSLNGNVSLNRIWFSGSWVYNFTIHQCLEKDVSSDQKPLKSVKVADKRTTFVVPTIFFRKKSKYIDLNYDTRNLCTHFKICHYVKRKSWSIFFFFLRPLDSWTKTTRFSAYSKKCATRRASFYIFPLEESTWLFLLKVSLIANDKTVTSSIW